MKIRLYQPIVFDGKTIEGDIDTNETPVNGESIIQRGWGEEIIESKGEKKSKQSAPSEAESEPASEPVPSATEPAEAVVVPEPTKPTKSSRKGK